MYIDTIVLFVHRSISVVCTIVHLCGWYIRTIIWLVYYNTCVVVTLVHLLCLPIGTFGCLVHFGIVVLIVNWYNYVAVTLVHVFILFTDSALWAGSIIETCLFVSVSVCVSDVHNPFGFFGGLSWP